MEILNRIVSIETPNPSHDSSEKLLKEKVDSMSGHSVKLELEEWRQFVLDSNESSIEKISKEERIKDIFFVISNISQIDLAVAGKNILILIYL